MFWVAFGLLDSSGQFSHQVSFLVDEALYILNGSQILLLPDEQQRIV